MQVIRRVLVVALGTTLSLSIGVARADSNPGPGYGYGQANPGNGTVSIAAVNTGSTSMPYQPAAPAASPASSGSGGGGGGGGGGSSSGPCGAGQAASYQGATAAPAWPIAGTPVPAGSTVQNTYCNGALLSTNIVPVAAGGGGPAPAAAPPPPSPQQLAQMASAQLRLPVPGIQLSPPPNINQYVNSPTWAWLPASQWTPLSATAAAGPVVVTATASPTSMVIDYTDGGSSHSTTCSGPGTPYSVTLADQEDPLAPFSAASPDCGWTFATTSAGQPGGKDPVTATITYDVTWAVTGAPGGGDLGPLTSPPATFALPVGEIQVLNTP